MTYENDVIARYLASRVISGAMTYDKAITNQRTSKEAIDWWLVEFSVD